MSAFIFSAGMVPFYAGQQNTYSDRYAQAADRGGTSLRRRESEERQQSKAYEGNRTVAQARSYGQTLAASRSKSKEVALEKKKVQYNYKAISSQILRSKTSTQAGTAVSKAKREVQRLKRLMNGNSNYDEDELRAAIDHAKSMERVAKKKVAHLRQEEAVERSHNSVASAMEEIEDERREDGDSAMEEEMREEGAGTDGMNQDAAMQAEDQMQAGMKADAQAQAEEMQAEMEAQAEAMQKTNEAMREQMTGEMQASAEELTEEMMAGMTEAMSDMLEELGLDELADSMIAPNPNMSEEDLKKLKLKHRTDEMKAMTRADADYLKVIFDKYQKEKAGGAGLSIGGGSGSADFAGGSSMPACTSISTGLSSLGLPMASAPTVSIDVSV